jgi:hypothetical protein
MNTKKRKRQKEERTSAPALYHGIFMLKSNVDTSIELDTIMCTKNKKVWTLGWVNMGNDLTREHVFLPLPTTSWSYFYSPGFRRVTLL